jgi:methyl-accepting chemotaxis protein
MARSKGNGEANETRRSIEEDLDALFRLPLADFTVARNALATRLKKAGSFGEAEQVKALGKPPVSAWAVNQLYWRHNDAFKKLIATGERLASAQASQLAGRPGDMRALLTARREMLASLLRLAEGLLRDAGHNPTPDTTRRITGTLEALSTYSGLSDAPRPGRLTADVEPPGFESLAALIPRVDSAHTPVSSTEVRKPKQELQGGASAKAALQAAEQALRDKRTSAEDAAAALKKATAHASQMENERRDAEERLAKARVAAEEARQRLHAAAAEADKASKALEEAERAVEKARRSE